MLACAGGACAGSASCAGALRRSRPRTSRPSSSRRRRRSFPASRSPSRCASRSRTAGTPTGRNPGDSGLPTTLAWKLPAGVDAGPIEWPAPRALPVGPLVNYGYEGEVLHLVDDHSRSARSSRRRGCRCSPRAPTGSSARKCAFPKARTSRCRCRWRDARRADPRWGAAIAAARAALPQPLAGWRECARAAAPTIKLTLVPPPGAADPGRDALLPVRADKIEPSGAADAVARDGERLRADAAGVAPRSRGPFDALAGVDHRRRRASAAAVRAATIDVAVAGSVVAGAKPRRRPRPRSTSRRREAPTATRVTLVASPSSRRSSAG